jgi:hypothetical protein
LDFSVSGADDPNSFFPVSVQFSSTAPFCGVNVGRVVGDGGAEVNFSQQITVSTDEYKIV